MSDIRKLVFFERGVETLTYFSHEMAASFRKMGYQIFFFDIQAEYADTKRLSRFLKSGETAVITFNFIGLSGEAVSYTHLYRCLHCCRWPCTENRDHQRGI